MKAMSVDMISKNSDFLQSGLDDFQQCAVLAIEPLITDLTKRPRFEHVGEQVQFPLNCEIFGRRLDLFGACVVVDAHADLFSSGEAKAEGATAAVG